MAQLPPPTQNAPAPPPDIGCDGSVQRGAQAQARQFASHSIWSGFYKKALRERQQQLRLVYPHLFPAAHLPTSPVSASATQSEFGSRVASAASLSLNGCRDADTAPNSPALSPSPTLSPSLSLETGSVAGDSPDGKPEARGDGSPNMTRNGGPDDSLMESTSSILRPRWPIQGLDEDIANNMVENCIGTIGLPLGLALNFTINGVPLVIPMAVEEPSVIAAVSGAAKTVSQFAENQGFTASSSERNVIFAQVQLLDVNNDAVENVLNTLLKHRDLLIAAGNEFIPNMVTRGGGVTNIEVRRVRRTQPVLRQNEVPVTPRDSSYWIVVHFRVDVCDAMGANCAATIAEGVAPLISELTGARVGLRIVSNLATDRITKASFRIPVKALAYKGFHGEQVARRIVEAYHWANDDPYRACTHNKGIMNGVDAVAIATGQDWRAIEAAAHAFASTSNGSSELDDTTGTTPYRSLTKYWIERDPATFAEHLCGELKLPVAVGTKGGVLKTHPVYNYTLGIMGFPNAKNLAQAMVCVGLAQNFAALRALVTEGIQRGHMSLHARNIAMAAGAPPHAINECVAYMVGSGRINLNAAREYLLAHELHSTIERELSFPRDASATAALRKPPSMLYFEESLTPGGGLDGADSMKLSGLEGSVSLNIAFQTLGDAPVNIEFTERSADSDLARALFGDKTFAWLMNTFALLDDSRLTHTTTHSRANAMLVRKLKYLSVLLNIITQRMVEIHPRETKRFIDRILGQFRGGGFRNVLSPTVAGSSGNNGMGKGTLSAPSSAYSSPKKPSTRQHLKTIRSMNVAVGMASLSHAIGLSQHESSLPSDFTASPLHVNTTLDPASPDAATRATAHSQRFMPEIPPPLGTTTSWTLPDTGVFRKELFNAMLTRDSIKGEDEATGDTFAHSASSGLSTNDLLAIGMPLLLSIWQVFELRVIQFVGHKRLRSVLLEEQRRIVSAIVSGDVVADLHPAPPVPSTTHFKPSALGLVGVDAPPLIAAEAGEDAKVRQLKQFSEFMAVHAKRFQTTLFLLCDAVNLDPVLITDERLRFLLSLGMHLEWEQARLHDVSAGRLERDLVAFGARQDKHAMHNQRDTEYPLPRVTYLDNSFCAWAAVYVPHVFATNGLLSTIAAGEGGRRASSPSGGSGTLRPVLADHLRAYLVSTDLSAHRAQLLTVEQPREVFDRELFDKVIAGYRTYYNIDKLGL